MDSEERSRIADICNAFSEALYLAERRDETKKELTTNRLLYGENDPRTLESRKKLKKILGR